MAPDPKRLATFRAIRAAFLARTTTTQQSIESLLGLALPSATVRDLLETWVVERRGY